MTDFFLGADRWPGLSKLIEEAGEVLQVAGKIVRRPGPGLHWDGTDLQTRLADELGDVLAAADFVVHHQGNEFAHRVEQRRRAKLQLFKQWHDEAPRSDVAAEDSWPFPEAIASICRRAENPVSNTHTISLSIDWIPIRRAFHAAVTRGDTAAANRVWRVAVAALMLGNYILGEVEDEARSEHYP